MRWLAVGSFVMLFFACVGRLPRPVYVEQTTAALNAAGYPPPPARVEFVPKQPDPKAVWIDGEWLWQGRRWAWRIGRWVIPPPNGRFAPWTMVRSSDGSVYYASGTWVDDKHADLAEPAALATARENISDVVDPEGVLEKTGKTVHVLESLDGGPDGSPAATGEGLRGYVPPDASAGADGAD